MLTVQPGMAGLDGWLDDLWRGARRVVGLGPSEADVQRVLEEWLRAEKLAAGMEKRLRQIQPGSATWTDEERAAWNRTIMRFGRFTKDRDAARAEVTAAIAALRRDGKWRASWPQTGEQLARAHIEDVPIDTSGLGFIPLALIAVLAVGFITFGLTYAMLRKVNPAAVTEVFSETLPGIAKAVGGAVAGGIWIVAAAAGFLILSHRRRR